MESVVAHVADIIPNINTRLQVRGRDYSGSCVLFVLRLSRTVLLAFTFPDLCSAFLGELLIP